MSLHDMYFSKKNKNHIFSIIQDLVLNETGTDINQNMDYVDLYRIKYSLIFERVNTDNIIDLNKALIDEVAPLFINDIQTNYKSRKIEIVRPIKDTHIRTESKTKEKIIHSSERLTNSLNRYDYSVNLEDYMNEISIQEITIPEENNILFTNPLICVVFTFGSKKYENYCRLSDKLQLNNQQYNIYTPLQKLKVSIKDSNEVKINILNNNLLSILDTNDKIHVKKIKQITYQNQKYLSVQTLEDNSLNEKEPIGIYEDNKLIKTFLIDKIINNYLLIKDQTLEYNKKDKYYVLNMNLQNSIVLNFTPE